MNDVFKTKKSKGITLIALVITIIILIILAGVTISLTIGENGLISKAKQSQNDYNLAKEKEGLEIEILDIQTEIMNEEYRKATLNDLYKKLDKNKYTIELKYESIATTTEKVPTYSIVNKTGSKYYFTVDKELKIRNIEEKESKNPPISNAITSKRAANNLDSIPYNYSWDELETIAKIISNDNKTIVTEETTQLTITIDKKEYTIGVGDYKTITYDGVNKQVRIVGFNHDKLVDQSIYEGTNVYTGISFEFTEPIVTESMSGSSATNSGGWEKCKIRVNFLSTTGTLGKINIANKIKNVVKDYNIGSGSSTNKTCEDKLWLLSYAEVRGDNNANSYGTPSEGKQYSYYKMNEADNLSVYDCVIKKSGGTAINWWLRTPRKTKNTFFCNIYADGVNHTDDATLKMGICPGFCI